MKKITHENGYGTTYTFEVVEKMPKGYEVWNIGGLGEYIPICETSKSCNVNTATLKAIKLDKGQVAILNDAAGRGIKTIKSAKRTLARVAKTVYMKENQRRAEKSPSDFGKYNSLGGHAPPPVMRP